MVRVIKPDKALIVAGSTLLVGLWLASDPRCDRGCKTVAHHLIEHGINDFIAGLFA